MGNPFFLAGYLFNSMMDLSFAINQDNFAEKFHIKSGSEWTIEVRISQRNDD